MRQIKKGSVDRSVIIRIIDSTDGTPEEAVVWNTAGIDLWYRREGAIRTAITEATLATLAAAYSDGGFLHIDDGYYRLDLPDAAWATGASHVMIGGTVTGMIVIGQEVQLVNYDPEDTVRLGLTALPNAAANAAGGLPISTAGGLALDTKLANTNEVTAARMAELDAANLPTDIANVKTDTTAILLDTGTDGVVLPQAQADKVWSSSVRTLTAFSTALALSIWDVLETAIVTASTIGLKLKTNLDAAITTRSSHSAADVWAVASRTLTSFGTLIADIWASATRTLTSFGTLVTDTWASLTNGMTTAGSIGKKLADWVLGSDNMVKVSANAHTSGQTIAAVTGAVGSVTADVGITQAGADKVWGTAARTLTSFGTLIADIWGYATRTLSAFSTTLALSVWDVLETAIATASSIGLKLKTNLDATVSSRSTYAGGAVASVTGAVGSVTGNLGGNVTGSVGSLATQAKADVNAEVVDTLNVDTYAEPGQETPVATNTLVKKIGYLFKAWRNKKDNNGTENKLYADDATTVDQKQATTEAAGTVTKGEWATGP